MGPRLLAALAALTGLAHAWQGPVVVSPHTARARSRRPTMLSYDSEQPAPSDVDRSVDADARPVAAAPRPAPADMDAFIMLEGPPSFFWPSGEPAPGSTKPVLVYLPGIEFTGYTISSQLERLKPLYDVRIFRVTPSDRTPAAELGTYIDAEIDALCATGRPVVLMGESFGGVLALDFALRAAAAGTQERVKHLVLMNPATCIGATPWRSLVPTIERLPPEVFGLVPLALSPLLANPLRLIDFAAAEGEAPSILAQSEEAAGVSADAFTRDPGPFPELLKAVEGWAARGLAAVGRSAVADPGEAGWAEPEVLLERMVALLPVLNQLPNALPAATLAFRARELHAFARDVNGRDWSSVRVPTLVISSSNDLIIPSAAAARQIQRRLLGTRVLTLDGAGHAPLIEADVDLPSIFARARVLTTPRPRPRDYVTGSRLADAAKQREVSARVMQPIRRLVSPRFFSTTASGLRLPGVGAVPAQLDPASGERRPILFVGNHQQIGVLDIPLVVEELLVKRGILARALAHPIAFASPSGAAGDELELSEQQLQMANRGLGESELAGVAGPAPSLSKLPTPAAPGRAAAGGMFGDALDISEFGAVPVSGRNLFRLLQRKEAVLLYPGGIREAFKARGEKYKLFWPEGDDEADFMRLAAKLDALVVPIAAVGADDVFHLVDPEQVLAIPGVKASMERVAESMPQGRAGEQFLAPVILPRLPLPRYYFCFGKPIDARLVDANDKRATADAYAQVQTELEACMDWLLDKRRHDPYKNFVSRVAYEAASNWERQAPTFPL